MNNIWAISGRQAARLSMQSVQQLLQVPGNILRRLCMEYKAWVVVADSSRAKIFGANARGGNLTELESYYHPESRMQEKEIFADRPGRFYSMQGEFRTAAEHTPVRKVEAVRFAQQLVEHLNKNFQNRKFERLVLVAAPGFLGTLRSQLSDKLRKALGSEVDKDLSNLEKPEDIRKRLPEYLW